MRNSLCTWIDKDGERSAGGAVQGLSLPYALRETRKNFRASGIFSCIKVVSWLRYYYYYYTIWMSLVTGLFVLVLLFNQRWSPPLRLQALLLLLLLLLLLYDRAVSCHRPFLPGTSLESAVIPTAQASSFIIIIIIIVIIIAGLRFLCL